MDICINLLPPEILERHEKKHRQRLLSIAGGILLTVLVLTFIALGVATARVRAEAAQLQQQRQALEARVQSMEQYTMPQASLKQLEDLVSQAVGTPPDWENLIGQIGTNITPGVWLTDLSASSSPAGGLIVRGYAFDHPSVALWLEEFRRVPGITDVRCQFSSLEDFQGQPMIQFEIKAALLPGPAYQPPVEKAGEDSGGK